MLFLHKHRNIHNLTSKWQRTWWRHQIKHFPRYWPFVREIHRSPVNSPHKGQWRGALMFTLICVWINGCVNNREAGDLGHYCAHYDVTVMIGWDEPRVILSASCRNQAPSCNKNRWWFLHHLEDLYSQTRTMFLLMHSHLFQWYWGADNT